jgi:peptide/nickel transport system permease protein
VLIVTLATFLLFRSTGVDPAVALLGEAASLEDVKTLRTSLGLELPVIVQFANWVGSALHGDFGLSYFSHRPVADLLAERLPITLSIAAGGIVLGVVLGIPLGLLAARLPNSILDRVVTAGSTVLLALPAFWLALLLVLVFAVQLRVFPVVGYVPITRSAMGWTQSLILPWTAVGLSAMATIARQARSAMIETMASGYVRSLTLRGIPAGRIVRGYAVKNSMLPVLATIILQAQLAIGAGFIIEVVFAIPGMGKLLLDSVMGGDLPVLQGAVVVVALVVVLLNLIGDVLYGVIDPKVRPN